MQENKETRNAALWGLLLIAAGIIFLLQNLGWFGGLTDLLWTGLFGGGGLIFLYIFLHISFNYFFFQLFEFST